MGDYADLLIAQDQAAMRRAAADVRPEALPSPGAPAPTRPLRRTITRCAFEIHQDQLDRLRALALREKLEGGRGSMSAIVREAIDQRLDAITRTPEPSAARPPAT
jgi:hypothetical protein